MARAYAVAPAGQIIEVRRRRLPAPEVPAGTKAVTFRGVAGQQDPPAAQPRATTSRTTASTSTPTAARPHGAVLRAPSGALNVTFKNSRIGNVVDEKGAMLGGSDEHRLARNLVIDNVEFHDVVQRGAGVHNECIFSQSPGLTIRNSTFRNCATMDLSLRRGDWWGQPHLRRRHAREQRLRALRSTAAPAGTTTASAWFIGKFENARVVNNTFENSVAASSRSTSAAARTRACGPTTSAAAGAACPA